MDTILVRKTVLAALLFIFGDYRIGMIAFESFYGNFEKLKLVFSDSITNWPLFVPFTGRSLGRIFG